MQNTEAEHPGMEPDVGSPVRRGGPAAPQRGRRNQKGYIYFLIHRKLWLGCFNPSHLGGLGESLAFPLALPGAPVVSGDFLGAGGGAGAEDAAAAAAAPRCSGFL